MPSERFYIKTSFEVQKHVSLEKEEFHHLANVMKIKVGEIVELVNGLGSLALARLIAIGKHNATLQIISFETKPLESHSLVLAQGIPRLPKLEFILEKSIELGVTEIWLFPAVLSEKKEFSPNQIQRMEYIAISAMKQCGRLFLPKLLIKPSLLEWTSTDIPSLSFFGDTRSETPDLLTCLLSSNFSEFFISIGPEKGFCEKEVIYMEKQLQMKGVHLHENILRTETAAIHSISLASTCILMKKRGKTAFD